MGFKNPFLFILMGANVLLCGQSIKGPGIGVKDKKAIESEVARLAAKLTELQSYYQKYIDHRDNIREGFLHDSIFKLKGLLPDQIDEAFMTFDDLQDHLGLLRESIFAADPENKEKWSQELDRAASVFELYPELNVLKNQTLKGNWQKGMERVLIDRKTFLIKQLERIQALTKDIRALKKVNEKRIGRYQNILKQLKEWSEATPDTWEAQFNQPMPKSKLMWVVVETKKEIVTLKRSIFNLIKLITDEELRKDLMAMEELKYVF